VKLTFIDGSVTEPQDSGNVLIIHCCNDIPAMGAGVAAALAKKWPDVRKEYMKWGRGEADPAIYVTHKQLRLGEMQIISVDGDFRNGNGRAVVNLIGQRDTCDYHGVPPVRYEAVLEGLYKVSDMLDEIPKKTPKVSIIMPRICCSLAGGSWAKVEPLIKQVFDSRDIDITVYDFGPFNP